MASSERLIPNVPTVQEISASRHTASVCGCPAAVPARRQLQRADKTYSDDHDAVVQEAKANEGQRVVQQHCGTETNKQRIKSDKKKKKADTYTHTHTHCILHSYIALLAAPSPERMEGRTVQRCSVLNYIPNVTSRVLIYFFRRFRPHHM